MKTAFERDLITYEFDGTFCPGNYAYTWKGSRHVVLCDAYDRSDDILGEDTKLCTIVHELAHAVFFADDIIYGRENALSLAHNNPDDVIKNAENYCYFVETVNIFDYGFDSIGLLPNKRVYVTKGNLYIRYSDSTGTTIDAGYPKLIKGNWGEIPASFNKGFHSITTLRSGKTYVTKDGQYIRYSDSYASTVDPGYPLSIRGLWGDIPASFNAAFDSMTVLRNGHTYVTKGSQFVRYSDKAASTVDSGYPLTLQGLWGNLPTSFAESFDCMALLGNGKTYVTKGKEYIRYSDSSASTIDSGYPSPIKGNWGSVNFPGPQ